MADAFARPQSETQANLKLEEHHGAILKLFADDALREKVLSAMKNIGYRYVSLDLEGYRQGSLNEGVLVRTDPASLRMIPSEEVNGNR